MYPEGDAGGAPPADYGYSEGMKSKITRNLEGLIPLILIIIIGVFLAHKFGIIDVPFLGGSDQIQMLIIGSPSPQLLQILDTDKDIVYYRVHDAGSLAHSPAARLANYDVVLLDQHTAGNPSDKAISRALGEAIENFVRSGGKLIVVQDSGIYKSGGIGGTGIATDSIGWEASMGDTVPVKCDELPNRYASCTVPISITGAIFREDPNHPIMEGIERAPADIRLPPITTYVFDVTPTGKQIAYIKNEKYQTYYPAIVEKQQLIGKSIYFNYDPALTPSIWENTLEYLR